MPRMSKIPRKDYHPARHIGMINSHQSPHRSLSWLPLLRLLSEDAFMWLLKQDAMKAPILQDAMHAAPTLRDERLFSFLTEPWYAVTQLLCTVK